MTRTLYERVPGRMPTIGLVIVALALVTSAQTYAQVPAHIFVGQRSGVVVGPMSHAHDVGQELLLDGRVLVPGGHDFTVVSEIYDPQTRTFTPTGNLNVGRCYGCGHLLLPSGKVLVAGGWTGCCGVRRDAELFDPTSGTFTLSGGTMADGRLAPSLAQLPTGKILVVGGHDGFSPLPSAELYDPATDQFALTNAPLVPRLGKAVPLPDGRVLWVGGSITTPTAEIYDPTSSTFSFTGSMSTPRHNAAVVRLADGRVLVAGGIDGTNTPTASVDLYDPSTGQFTAVGSLRAARQGAFAIALADGRALVGGGANVSGIPSADVDIFDPATATFSSGAPLLVPRIGMNATLLTDGSILVSGGDGAGGARLTSAELYFASSASGTLAPTITYGTPLSETLLPVSSDVPGTFSYSPSLGTVLDVGVWPVTITFTPADLVHYAPASAQAEVSVVPAQLSVTVSDVTQTFDGTGKMVTVATSPSHGSVSITYNGLTTLPIDAGAYDVVATVVDPNYTGSTHATLLISRAQLTVKAADVTKVVGATTPAFSATYSGFPAGQSAANLVGSLTFTTPSASATTPGTYLITPGGVSSSNYDIVFVDGTLRVTNNVCVLFDGTRPVKSGSTLPIKLALCDAGNSNRSSGAVLVTATGLRLVSGTTLGDVQDAGQANPDANFRFLAALPGYIFNLQTTGLPTGTYELRFTAQGDPLEHQVYFGVR